jgi:predicted nucleotidyltransferase
MSRTERDVLVAALAAALARTRGVELAILFGSTARATHTPASDIDLAVKLEPGVDALQLADTLARRIQREVQVVSLDNLNIPLLEQIVRDGVVVHQASSRIAAVWWSRALSTLALDGPWYARMNDSWLRHVAQKGLG